MSLAFLAGATSPATVFAGSGKLHRARMAAETELRLLLLQYEDALSSGKPEAAAPLFRDGAIVSEPGHFRGSYLQYVARVLKSSLPRLRADEWVESRVELDVEATKPIASAKQSLIWWQVSPHAQSNATSVYHQAWVFEKVGGKWFVSRLELHRQRHASG